MSITKCLFKVSQSSQAHVLLKLRKPHCYAQLAEDKPGNFNLKRLCYPPLGKQSDTTAPRRVPELSEARLASYLLSSSSCSPCSPCIHATFESGQVPSTDASEGKAEL